MLDCCDNFVPKVLEQLRLDYAPLCGVVGQEFEVVEVIRSHFSEIFCCRSSKVLRAHPIRRYYFFYPILGTLLLPHFRCSVLILSQILRSHPCFGDPFSPQIRYSLITNPRYSFYASEVHRFHPILGAFRCRC